MKLEGIDIDGTLSDLESSLKQEKGLSPSLKSMIEVLILLVKMLTNRVGLNSSNSSKPPSTDPNRKKKKRHNSNKNSGGQKGHKGCTLNPIEDPDEMKSLTLTDEHCLKALVIKKSVLRNARYLIFILLVKSRNIKRKY